MSCQVGLNFLTNIKTNMHICQEVSWFFIFNPFPFKKNNAAQGEQGLLEGLPKGILS